MPGCEYDLSVGRWGLSGAVLNDGYQNLEFGKVGSRGTVTRAKSARQTNCAQLFRLVNGGRGKMEVQCIQQ